MNVSFDLETLGKTNKAPIIQVGAVLFDDEGKHLTTFNRNCFFGSIPEGFEIDYSTIGWWFEQLGKNPELVKSVHTDWNASWYSQKTMLSEFIKWISKYQVGSTKPFVYWSHATFDPGILKHNFKVHGFGDEVIPFRQFLDIRTLTHLTNGDIKITRDGHHHDALADAKTQANYVTECLNYIKFK